MADNNYIEITARLNMVKSGDEIQKQLNELAKKLSLQLDNVVVNQNGLNALQSSIDAIQKNLHLNIGNVAIDQSQTVKQAQVIAQQMTNAMKVNVSPSANVSRAFDISDNVAKSLKKRYSDVAVLSQELQNRFAKVGNVTTEVLSHENKLIDQFRVTVTNADGAVEKLVYHLNQVEGTKRHEWAVTSATSTDNNIKLQEQSIKQQEQSARRLNAELNSSFKTLKHDAQIMDNLSHRQIFNTNASAPEVESLLQRIQEADDKFDKLKHDFETKPATTGLLTEMKELNGVITSITSDSHKLARALSQSTSNVNPEAELNNLKTLMNNLKASDVEVDKLKADYGELVGLFMQAKDTGNFTTFFTQLETFKSKFTEAKSEVRATNAEIADLEKMARNLSSNKMNNFFNANSGNVQVNTLKTEIVGLVNEWTAFNQEIQNTGRITPSMQTRLDELRVKMQNATSAADNLQKNIKKIADSQKLATQRQSLDTRITSWLQNNTRASQETRQALIQVQQQIQNADRQKMTNLSNQLREITARARAAGEAGKTLGDTIREKLGKFAGWFSIATVVMRAVNELKNMYKTVVELDSAMVGLRKVSNETEQAYNDFFVTATKNAKELGATITDVINSTTEFARLGYNLADATKLSEVATLYKNVGDGIDIDQATTSIISTMKAFNITADNALEIVDKYNKVGNEFAISSGGIGEALQRSASALANAKNSLSESVALTVAANNVVQDPSVVGNMWKTVALRMTQAKSEIEKMGEDTDGMLESTAKYRDLIKASTGFDILEKDNKTLKSTYEIVLNIGKAWGSLSDIDRNSLLYSLAGTRQSNALAAALNNIDDMQKAYEAAENATGSAQEEQEKYTKSIQYSIDVFKAAKEEFANNLYDSKGLKNTIDGFTKMLEVINSLTKSVGGLGTAFTAFMAYKGFKNVGRTKMFVLNNRICRQQ